MLASNYESIATCRGCAANSLVDILDLGHQPLANALVRTRSDQIGTFPLATAFCPQCSLFQLKDTIKKEILFDQYFWVTGTSQAAQEYSKIFFQRVVTHCKLEPESFIVEIASNDGTILKQFLEGGHQVLGIEPAKNIAQIATEAGVPTLCTYWDTDTARYVLNEYGNPNVVIARNVIPHVSELHEVIAGMALVIGDSGIGVIEFHDGSVILRELHYDSIYHEHLCYFTIRSMTQILNRYGLHPFRVDSSPISGGSHVIYFAKHSHKVEESYFRSLLVEDELGANTSVAWEQFARKAFEHKNSTLGWIRSFEGKKIVGFGASARSSTYLNFCGLTSIEIQAMIDNNPLKQGWWTPGSAIPIVSRNQGLELKPDVIFVLAWNLKDEIMNECRAAGFRGAFLIPFPGEPYLVPAY